MIPFLTFIVVALLWRHLNKIAFRWFLFPWKLTQRDYKVYYNFQISPTNEVVLPIVLMSLIFRFSNEAATFTKNDKKSLYPLR